MAWTNILGQSRVGVRTGVLAQQNSYLLDTYSGAAAAYSLRKLNGSYTGSAIRVRRSNDNAEQDIAFDASGNLDTTSMLNFVGGQNLYLPSEDLSGFNWGGNGVNRTSNTGVAPDGITPANLLSEQSTLNNHNLSYSVGLSITAGRAVNHSVYLKKGPGSNAPDIISLYVGNATFNMRAVFNISTGQVLNTTNGSASGFEVLITDAGNGWWRCSIGGTLPHTTTQTFLLLTEFCNNVNSTTRQFYLGNVNANVYVWGLQYSNTNSVQPYSKTTTITAGNGFVTTWYDQSSTYNAAQTTASKQPQIVSSGNLLTQNSKPTIKFDGSDDFLLTGTYSFTSTDKLYGAYVSTTEVSNANSMVVGQYKQFSTAVYLLGYTSTSYTWVTTRNLANTTAYSYAYGPYAINTQYLSEAQLDLSNTTSVLKTKSWRNNVLEVMTTNGGAVTSLPTFAQPISIGADTIGTTFKLKGNIQEIVLYYNQDKTNDRSGIASNINNYYNIYTPTTPSLSTGLFGIWNGNGNTNDSYSTLTGEARGGLTYSIGKNGSAFTFNGSNTTMVAFPVNSWATGDNFSFSLWFNVTSLSGNSQALISNYSYYNPTMTSYGWGLRVVSGGLVFQRFYPQMEEYSGGTPVANQWQHAVVTRNGSVTKIYLNGDLVGGKYSTAATVYSNTVPRIGARMDTDTTNSVWQVTNGSKIDEVYLWNKALTDVEVKELYNSGNGKFYPFN
jgi:hypothetical protein